MPRSGKLPAKLIHSFCDLAHRDADVPQLEAMLAEHPELLAASRPGSDKETALGAATHMRAKKVIKLLLDHGAEKDVYLACALGEVAVVEKFLDRNPKQVAARAGHIHGMDLIDLAPNEKMVEMLLKRGYPLTIHVAAAKGMIPQIDRLLAADPASLEARGREKETPLFCAIWSGRDAAAIHLLEKGCRHDVDGAGGRPMHYACSWGRSKAARALLDRGIDIDFIGLGYRFGYLHACCFWGADGMGSLDRASYEKEVSKIIRWLLEAGIDTSLRDKQRLTARELALKSGFAERAALIEEFGKEK